MCRPVTCRTCGKTTWAGCGQHVDSVKATVPPSDWCGGQHPKDATTPKSGGFLRRLLGR